MFKNLKLRSKLLTSFFLITCLSTIATTVFSIYYFSDVIYDDALENLEKSSEVAKRAYVLQQEDLLELGQSLAQDRGFQLLVQFDIRHKINRHLNDFVAANPVHQALAVTPEGRLLGRAGPLEQDNDANEHIDNALLEQALRREQALVATERVRHDDADWLTITAAAPVLRSQAVKSRAPREEDPQHVVGAVLLRYILNADTALPSRISNLLGVNAAFYLDTQVIAEKTLDGQPSPLLSTESLRELHDSPSDRYIQREFYSGGYLAAYHSLRNIGGAPIGVMGISLPADKFLSSIQRAMLTLLAIMLLCIIAASLLGYWLARSILVPINQLLTGVKRVTSGDLSHEIVMDLRDELGTLANAFNSMSRQLHDLFNTLEQRIESATGKLQNTLAHLAAIIDNMADGLLVTDSEGKVIRTNPALAAMFPEQRCLLEQPAAQFGAGIAHLVREAGQITQQIHSAEIELGHGRVGQAVATAILRKDSFADDDEGRYIGSRFLGTVILIRDITREKEADRVLKNTVNTLTRVGNALASERNSAKLLEVLVTEARTVCHADGGTLYTVKNGQLHFEIVQNVSMNIFMGGTTGQAISLPPISLEEQSKIAAYCATHKQVVRAPDVYQNDAFDFSATKQYDQETGYRTHAMLAVPLLDRQNQSVGVLQVINPQNEELQDGHAFTNNQVELVFALASLTAVAIENARNYEKIENKNKAFERFVPTEFLHHLDKKEVEDVQLGEATEETMSVLFSDIRSFTSLSEQLTPQDNFVFLNDYLAHIGPSIVGNQGFIDKYIGDAIMALFTSKTGLVADNAVRAGIGMLQQLQVFNRHQQQQGFPPLHIGIGIHTGPLTLGIIGFERRMESTVIGDTVNLASRMEGLTKQYGIEMGISGMCFDELSAPEEFLIREVDTVQVKGKEQAITVYQVFDADPEPLREKKAISLSRYQEALNLYKAGEWKQAQQLFREIRYLLSDDKVIALYLQRCEEFLARPPQGDDWAITRLTQK